MFLYLSKKIAIPHGIPLKTVGWNEDQGWIACGGGSGLLKVLKLDGKVNRRNKKNNNNSKAQPTTNLTMNQTLEGHTGTVCCVTWNEAYRKLTTSDDSGLIIVWMLHKGMWFEEMINNRNKSVVKDMKWTTDGSKICIIYEDGAVIVGSVDGNRLWGKELEIELSHVEWSPDGRHLLFGTMSNEVLCYDALGNMLSKINIYANNSASNSKIVNLVWYNGLNGHFAPNCPALAIVFDNGRVQIGRDELDDAPVLIDTGMTITHSAWNHNGSILALSGNRPSADSKETSQVQCYSPLGKHLRTLKVPGGVIEAISWEGGGLRLALAVDSFIYFANLRPDYQWGYFSHTLVYAYNKLERTENCVVFWDTMTDERQVKYVKNLLTIKAAGDHCIFATKTDDDSNQYVLILCNAIGSPVDSKYIDIEPLYVTMTPFHCMVSNGDIVYVWQYSTAISKLTSVSTTLVASNDNSSATAGVNAKSSVSMGGMKRKENREKSFHIDDPISGITSNLTELNSSSQQSLLGLPSSNDPIVAMTASKTAFIIARASGQLLRFSLPHLALDATYVLHCRAQLLALNCNSSRLSIIDINGICTLFDFDGKGAGNNSNNASALSYNSMGNTQPQGTMLDFERKDAWDMIWSDDNPELFACMEKTRMYVFRGLLPEEPIQSSAYLCNFNDLCIKAVNLDDIMQDPEQPDKDLVLNFETKSLRDTRELLISTPISEATQFIEDNSHIRLWRLLGETALEQLNFTVADKAFVHCKDYQGIQFTKRLKLLNDPKKQRAEVSAYFRRFDEAESLYMSMEAKDDALELRMRLGDWFRVVQLITVHNAGDDAMLNLAYDRIGDYYADRQKWHKAYKFYSKANHTEKMIECAYILDDYTTLVTLIDTIPTSAPYLLSLAEKFQSVGLCNEAVAVYLKAEQPKQAIDCCVLLNQWDEAVRLAEQYKVEGIAHLLSAYATHLLSKEKYFQAVELYRKAGKHLDSARLLVELAEKEGKKKGKEVRTKKLYVMAAMEMEKHKEKTIELSSSIQNTTTAADALKSLLDADVAGNTTTPAGATSSLSSIWHGAEAYHFLLLAQRQLYNNQLDLALHTAVQLCHYDDVLDSRVVYSILALAAYAQGYYNICSKAFVKLEQRSSGQGNHNEANHNSAGHSSSSNCGSTAASISGDEDKYTQVALSVFLLHPPVDPVHADRDYRSVCHKCNGVMEPFCSLCADCGKDYGVCVASGRSLVGYAAAELVMCRQCRHRAIESEWRKCQFCPLCHSSIR